MIHRIAARVLLAAAVFWLAARPTPVAAAVGNVNMIRLAGGSFSGGSFTENGSYWDTDPQSGRWVVGVTAAGAGNPLLNASDKSVNIPSGTYYAYTEPYGLGTAIRVTVAWSDGSLNDVAIFSVGSLNSASSWTRLTGSANIALGGTGLLTQNRVGQGLNPSGSAADNVFQLTISGSGGGACTYALSTTSQSMAAAGGSNTVGVTAAAGCPWTAVSNASWITVTSGASGSGNGTIGYSITANPSSIARTGTITIGGQALTVTQGGVGCNYSLSQSSASVAAAGGAFSVSVTSPGGCSWTAISNAAWITVTSGASGSSNGTVTYGVSANTTASPRTGTITIAGVTFAVTQAGVACSYSLSQNSASAAAAGGAGSVSVTGASGCSWTATSNDTSWLTVTSGASGSGNGTVGYSVAANTNSSSRTGTITIAGQTFTLTQAGAACAYTLSPTSISAAAAGTSGSITVTTPSGCAWTAAATVSWISITGGASGTGNGTVTYTVAANTGSSSRTGTITIGGQTFTVTQSGGVGPCTYRLETPATTAMPASTTGSLAISTQAGCPWTAVSNASWITITSATSGAGATIIFYKLDTNNGQDQRLGTITVGGQTFTITQIGMSACSFMLTSTSATAPASGTTGFVNVMTSSGCPISVVANAAWITITSSDIDLINGLIKYSVAANAGAGARTGTITIAGLTYTITQAGASPSCTYGISPASASFTAAGGTGSVLVTSPSGCTWTAAAASSSSWITVSSGASGSGSGTVQYTVGANTSTSSRTGTMSIASQTHTVTQAGAATQPPGNTPAISPGGVVNTADFTANFAPGIIISIFGQNLAPSTTLAGAPPLPTSLAGTSVEALYSGRTVALPLFFVSTAQVNAQLPFDVPLDQVQIRVRASAGVSDTQTIRVDACNPRIFTVPSGGRGAAAALHSDYSAVSDQAPATPGEWLTLYLTGMGAVSPAIAAGQPAGDGAAKGPFNRVAATVTVTVGGVSAEVYYAGLAPSYAGLYQINFKVPDISNYGSRAIRVLVGGQQSQSATSVTLGMQWATLNSASVGPAGGTVTAGPASITVPPGVVTAPTQVAISKGAGRTAFDDTRISEVYSVSGVPFPPRSPITLTINLSSPPPNPNEVLMVAQPRGEGSAPVLLKARVAGSSVTATLPSTTTVQGPASGKSRVAETGSNERALGIAFFLIGGWQTDESLHFYFEYKTKLVVDRIRASLEAAYSAAEQAGLLTGSHFKADAQITVVLVPFECEEPWGELHYGYGGAPNPDGFYVSNDLLTGPVSSIQPKVMHMFMHYVISKWDPRQEQPALEKMENPWLWLDEAMATWSERTFDSDYIPEQAVGNSDFLQYGLESTENDEGSLRAHGYGASMFLEWMRTGGNPPAQILSILKYRNQGSPSDFLYMPVEALQMAFVGQRLGESWQSFCLIYPLGTFYGGSNSSSLPVPGWNEQVLAANAKDTVTFNPDDTGPKTFSWQAPDLSARFFLVNFPSTWKTDPDLVITLENTAGQEATALFYPVSVSPSAMTIGGHLFAIEGGGSFSTLQTGIKLAPRGNSLLIVVVNSRAVKAYDRLSNITLTVQVGAPTDCFVPKGSLISTEWKPVAYLPGYGAEWTDSPSRSDIVPSGFRWTSPREFAYTEPGSASDEYFKVSGRLSCHLETMELYQVELRSLSTWRVHKISLTARNLPRVGNSLEAQYFVTGDDLKQNFSKYVTDFTYTLYQRIYSKGGETDEPFPGAPWKLAVQDFHWGDTSQSALGAYFK